VDKKKTSGDLTASEAPRVYSQEAN